MKLSTAAKLSKEADLSNIANFILAWSSARCGTQQGRRARRDCKAWLGAELILVVQIDKETMLDMFAKLGNIAELGKKAEPGKDAELG